jgi:hypothetical protein
VIESNGVPDDAQQAIDDTLRRLEAPPPAAELDGAGGRDVARRTTRSAIR